MRRGTGTTIVLLVLSDDGLSNTVASIVMLQSLVLFPDRFFLFRAKRKKLFLFLSHLYFVEFFTMSLALAYGIRDWLDLQDTHNANKCDNYVLQ